MSKFRNAKGFTLVEIMIVVAIIGILIAIAVPGFIRARSQSRVKACQENLVKIDGAVEQYALENNKKTGDPCTMTEVLQPNGAALGDGYLKVEPFCPSNSNTPYVQTLVGTAPLCPAPQPGHSLSEIGTVTSAVEQ